MKGKTFFAGIAFLLLPFLAKAEGGKSQIPLADPYILLDGDTYYAYGTHDASGIRCYSSTDLRVWKDEGQALNKANTTEQKNFWAPEVYRIKGKYIMYFSANEHLFAATADSPKGPFKQVGSYQMENLINDEKCIDSHVFIDEDSTAYIFFVRFTDGNCIWQAKLSDDFITPVTGTLRKCFAASQAWELKDERVNEGPNVIKHGKRYYLTYSGNHYRCLDYAVGYAYTSNIASGTWTKYANNPILRRWDDLVGTGHHSLFYDKDGALRIVFHAHNSTEAIHDRLMYIGTMTFRANSLVMLNDPIIRPTLSTTAPYSPELITQAWGFRNGGAVTIDLNNDGSQDIVTGGLARVQDSATNETTTNRISYLATFAPTTHKWTKVTTAPPFKVTDSPSLVPCDINNDGNMDIIAFDQTGSDNEDNHEGIFLGKGNGTFEAAALVILNPDGSNASIDYRAVYNAEVIDIDNDARLDIILVGHQGETNCNVILHNQTTNPSSLTFTVESFEQDYLFREAIIQPADFNGDGWLDIMLAGLGESSSGETTTRQRIYINQATETPCFKAISCDFQTDIYTLSSAANNSAGVIDWDGDGDYDILLGGTKSNVYGGMLYLNDGKGQLKRSTAIPGATGASIIFPDYNGDGRKDFVVIGHSEDKNYLTTEQFGDNAILCYNLLSAPSRPDAPLAPTANVQEGGVRLAWQAAETAHPGFTYEVYIKDEAGNLLNSTPAIIGGANDGIRKVNRLGRIGTRTEWTFRPTKAGTYSWGVQAVDAAYTGSLFTEGPQFTVTEEDIETGLAPAFSNKEETIYNLLGQRLSKPHRGVNIHKGEKKTYKNIKL